MHTLEPFYNWRHRYISEEDDKSPFFGTEHSEFEFMHAVYDHAIHPQGDRAYPLRPALTTHRPCP